MRVLGGITHNSSKAILDTLEPAKVNGRQTSKQGITEVKLTSNQSVCSQKSSFVHKIPTELLEIPDMNKTNLTDIQDMA